MPKSRNIYRTTASRGRAGANALALAIGLTTATITAAPADAGIFGGGATEWTQLLNNAELVSIVGQSAEQIQNQVTQISQLAEQIQNQIRIYENMLQNTAQLPDHIWGKVESDLGKLQEVVSQGQGIAFSMGSIDDVLKQRFQSYADFKVELPAGKNFSDTFRSWSDTNRDTIAGTLKAANLTGDLFSTEEDTMRELRSMSESADGQMKALQVGHQIASQQVAQTQKLRGLVAQQMTMMGTWYQSEQAKEDLAQVRREQFFKRSENPSTSDGNQFRPEW
jgi:P-type conjugative transfer protein TrbJ